MDIMICSTNEFVMSPCGNANVRGSPSVDFSRTYRWESDSSRPFVSENTQRQPHVITA